MLRLFKDTQQNGTIQNGRVTIQMSVILHGVILLKVEAPLLRHVHRMTQIKILTKN